MTTAPPPLVKASPPLEVERKTPEPLTAAELVVTLRDEAGSPIEFSRVEILAAAWGVVRRMELATKGSRLTLDLAELRSLLAVNFAERKSVHCMYLYVEAAGYVPVRSERFLWNGSPFYQESAHELLVAFRYGERVTIDSDGVYYLDLVLRQPEPRYIRLVDDDGSAVEGMVVRSYMYWSSHNHCAVLTGADPLGTGVSDREGCIQIPDGDFEYALEIDRGYHAFRDPDVFPDRFVGFLERGETVIALHEMARSPLELRLTTSGQPLADTVIMGRLAGYACGATWGPLARTDETGRVRLPEFCHEKYESLYVNDASGTTVWKADPREWQGREVVRVDLGNAPPGRR